MARPKKEETNGTPANGASTELEWWTPERFRKTREELGLSRESVKKATGLTLAAIWRAEQPGKKIVSEEHDKIVTFLQRCQTEGVPAEYQRERVSSAARSKTKQVADLLDEALAAKTLKDAKDAVQRAKDVLG